jgi:predicted ester cyclase
MTTSADIPAIIRSYYAVFDAKTGNASTLDAILAPSWKNYSGASDFADQAGFTALLAGTQHAVPDLQWNIAEVLIAGDRVVVRGEGRGTPTGSFFGVPCNGRAFCIMSIDIHTVRAGRIQTSYHLEDWAGAIRQISAP